MKRVITLLIIIAAVAGGVFLYVHSHGAAEPPAAEKPADAAEGSHVSHDDQGNSVISMDDDDQGDAGIVVGKPTEGQWKPEIKGYGRVLDPATLVQSVNDLNSAQVTAAASLREYDRQKTLSAQNNTSTRLLQTAEAAAQHDQMAVQAARDHIVLAWGVALASRGDLSSTINLLVARRAVLIRVDLPGGEELAGPPLSARIVTLADQTTRAKYLGPAGDVDPQMQGQAFIFSVETNSIPLVLGQMVTAWLQVPGEPLTGVIVPRDAVVRAEGAGWVYVMNKGGESFTRRKIPLDRPTENGWFVTGILQGGDYIAVVGAQTLLSEELKAALSPD